MQHTFHSPNPPAGRPVPSVEPPDPTPHRVSPRSREAMHARRLSDKILVAFHAACDQRETETAAHLLDVVEWVISRAPYLPAGWERRARENLIAAHERLWVLRHPESEGM